MPFHIYRKTANNVGFLYEIHRRNTPLAGNQNGLIYRALTVANHLQHPGGQDPVRWHLSATDLLALDNMANEYAIVINLQPRATHLDYYELTDIWGFSYKDWTPVALRVEPLLANVCPVPNTDDYRWHFVDNNVNREQIHEFLYLRGGYDCGGWNWPPPSPTNGAMLWPDALEFFLDEIL